MTAHYVYEIYDAQDRLIYVGATLNLFGRLQQHRFNAWWADQAVKVKATVHPSFEARRIELRRISDLHPRWNSIGQAAREIWTAEQYRDYVTARHRRPPFVTTYSAAHLRRIAQEYRDRFGLDLWLPRERAS